MGAEALCHHDHNPWHKQPKGGRTDWSQKVQPTDTWPHAVGQNAVLTGMCAWEVSLSPGKQEEKSKTGGVGGDGEQDNLKDSLVATCFPQWGPTSPSFYKLLK